MLIKLIIDMTITKKADNASIVKLISPNILLKFTVETSFSLFAKTCIEGIEHNSAPIAAKVDRNMIFKSFAKKIEKIPLKNRSNTPKKKIVI